MLLKKHRGGSGTRGPIMLDRQGEGIWWFKPWNILWPHHWRCVYIVPCGLCFKHLKILLCIGLMYLFECLYLCHVDRERAQILLSEQYLYLNVLCLCIKRPVFHFTATRFITCIFYYSIFDSMCGPLLCLSFTNIPSPCVTLMFCMCVCVCVF